MCIRDRGIGILPMGWAKFIALAADDLADRFCDGAAHPAFAAFAPLGEKLRGVNAVSYTHLTLPTSDLV